MAESTLDPTELFRKASDILGRDFEIPTFSGVNTSNAKSELDKARKTRDESARTIDNSATTIATATAAEKVAILNRGRAEADAILANQERVQQLADQAARANSLFGISPDDFSNEIAMLAKSAVPLNDAARTKLKEVQEMQSVGPLDNPLEWLYNQVQLPSKIQDYNRSADQVNSIYDTIEKSTKVAQDLSAQWNKATPTITAKMAKAGADSAVAAADEKAAAADINLAKVNVEFATRKLAGDLSIASQTASMTQLDLQNNQAVYQSKIQAINLADTHANRLLKAGELLNTVGQTQALDKLLENYDAMIGNPKGTTNRYIFNRLNDAQQKNMVAIGAGSAGTNPYEFYVNMATARPGPGMSPETSALIRWVGDIATAENTALLKTTTDKSLIPAKIAKTVSEAIEREKINASNPRSLFHEIEPAKMIVAAQLPPQVVEILKPLATTTGSVDTATVAKTIAGAFNTPQDGGAAIASYYTQNLKIMQDAMNLKLAGIKPISEYKVKVRIGLFSSAEFDLTQPADATKYLLMQKQIAGQKFPGLENK